MKKLPPSIKPDVATYNIALRMQRAGMLRPGQALMLAATAGLSSPSGKLYDKAVFPPQKRGKSATSKRGRR